MGSDLRTPEPVVATVNQVNSGPIVTTTYTECYPEPH